jgi:hypothetical protein
MEIGEGIPMKQVIRKRVSKKFSEKKRFSFIGHPNIQSVYEQHGHTLCICFLGQDSHKTL